MTAFNPKIVSDDVVVRADERPRAILADGVVWEELAAPRQDMEPSHVVVPPGGGTGAKCTHLGCRMVAAGGPARSGEARCPCKGVVAHTGFEPVLPP